MDALYTAATGMEAQETNMDNLANNLANVNTSGFKKSRVEFEDLVYEQLTTPGSPTSPTEESPIGIEVGQGVRVAGTARDFSRGNMRATNAPLDVAVEGRGLFQVTLPSGETAYTRAGGFHLNSDGLLVTAEGSPVEPQITIPPDAIAISISKDGIVAAALANQSAPEQVGTIELALFQNEPGLRALGGNLFVATEASGEPTVAAPGTDGLGTIAQGFVEESNVNVAEEMVNMIRAQRAFEANAQVMRTADEMLQQINSLIQ